MFKRITEYRFGLISIALLILFAFVIGSQAYAAEWLPLEDGAPPSVPSVFLDENTSDHLLIRWELQGAFVNDISVDGVSYQNFSLKNLMQVYNGAPGNPSLPMLVEIIHVPDMMKGSVELIDVEWVDLTTAVIYPQQSPARDDGLPSPPFIINEESYDQNVPFPLALVSTNAPQGWGGIAVSSVAVTPIRYFPAENRVQLAKSITVRVNFTPGGHNIVHPRVVNRQMQKLHQIAILNPPPDDPRPADADENEVVRMLFIMKEEALEITQPLIDFHHNTGLRTEVIFAEDLPDDSVEASEEIKDLIRERYEEGLEFVQIIGEPRTNGWDVPMFFWAPVDPGAQDDVGTASHSDSWYICLDDPDEDGFEDHLPELAIGRLTYERTDRLNELELQIAKLTDYLAWEFEERDEVGWLNNCILIAHRGEGGEYIRCKTAIEEFDYELETPEFITQYGNEQGVDNGSLIDLINGQSAGFVNYRGHGDTTFWSRWNRANQSFRINQVEDMENRTRPFILVSSACYNASIAERNGDSLLEAFQKQSGGSVSAHGSIISSYRWANSFFDEAIYKAFFDEGIYSIGYASNLAGTQMVMHYDVPFNNPNFYSLGRMNFRTYIWLGDPALQYRLGDQIELLVDISEDILIETEFIDVVVSGGDDNLIENARVCVRSEDDAIYQVAITDANGTARITFDPGMEEAGELFWTVQHRNAALIGGDILVANGFGMIEGTVLDLGNDEVIANAELLLSPFNVRAVSNNEGRFFFSGIPERENFTLTASAEGYVSLERDGINVVDEEVTEIDFLLAYSQLDPSVENITVEVVAGNIAEEVLTLTNSGTGNLTWSSWITDDFDRELFEIVGEEEISEELDDTSLNGVVLIGDFFYVAGGNIQNREAPNKVYKIDRETYRVESSFDQPDAGGTGFHDLATDGEYIYGDISGTIYKLTLDGEVVDEIEGPRNPNLALTIDDDGNIWVGWNLNSLIKIDQDGNRLQEIQNDVKVRGLAWSPLENDDFPLKMMVLGENNIATLYQANPETNEVQFVQVMPYEQEGEIPTDALYITNQFNPPAWSIIGMVKYDFERIMRVWHLHYDAEWISYAPDSGVIEPEASEDIILTFDAGLIEAGASIEAVLSLESDGRVPLIEIPIRLDVTSLSVGSEEWSAIPDDFGIVSSYPNPFNAFTKIAYNVPVSSYVSGSVFDLQGREILTIINANMLAGSHSVIIDGNLLSTGVYIVKIISDGVSSSKKIVLLK